MVRKRKIVDVSEEKEKESMGLEGGGGARKRFVGVRQRPSGRWVAEIKDTIQKIRVWLGTFDTAEAAARAYDEAACLLRGANTRTNFWPCSPAQPPPASVLPTKITNLLLLRLQASRNSQEKDDAFADAAAAASNADGDGRDKKGEEEDVKEASRSSSEEEEEEEEEQVVVDDVGDDMDFGFLDSSEGTCFYSPFEMAEEIEEEMPVLVDEEVGEGGGGDEPSILRAAMKRMKYERKISASLYALNGISECLRLRLQSYTSSNSNTSDGVQQQLNKEDDDGARHVQPEGSTSSSSNSNDDGERSMWSSLDLPSMHLFS